MQEWQTEASVAMTEAYMKKIDDVIAQGPYKDNWASLSRHKTPAWYTRDKFGIFIHWGVYSVPAYGNEWYPRAMYDKNRREYEYHRQTYGPQYAFGYKDFIPMFKAESFDPDAWAALFKRAGARFVTPVCEHHDGFAMYDTAFNRWNAKAMGPRRDVAAELKAACERAGLAFCASTHRAEHYFFLNTGRTCESDVTDPRYADFYGPACNSPGFGSDVMHITTADITAEGASEAWLRDWLARTCELIDRLQPSILYFDWWIHNHTFKPYLKKLAAYYYNRAAAWGKEVTINYKHQAFPPGVGTFDVERGALTDISPVPWQTDTAIGRQSWGYRADNEYKSARQIVCDLVDIVSKNGMLLLNIGPKADGTVTKEETAVLLGIGDWLAKNGEGIYGATFWRQFGEGEVNNEAGFFKDGDEKRYTARDFRFTYKGGCVYAFQMRPDGNDITVRAFAKRDREDFTVKGVTLLSTGEALPFERTPEGLTVFTGGRKSDLPLCLKIEID